MILVNIQNIAWFLKCLLTIIVSIIYILIFLLLYPNPLYREFRKYLSCDTYFSGSSSLSEKRLAMFKHLHYINAFVHSWRRKCSDNFLKHLNPLYRDLSQVYLMLAYFLNILWFRIGLSHSRHTVLICWVVLNYTLLEAYNILGLRS